MQNTSEVNVGLIMVFLTVKIIQKFIFTCYSYYTLEKMLTKEIIKKYSMSMIKGFRVKTGTNHSFCTLLIGDHLARL